MCPILVGSVYNFDLKISKIGHIFWKVSSFCLELFNCMLSNSFNIILFFSSLELIQSCWNECPEKRPDFSQIRTRLKKLNQGRSSNIMDKMIELMEFHTTHLEELGPIFFIILNDPLDSVLRSAKLGWDNNHFCVTFCYSKLSIFLKWQHLFFTQDHFQ